MSKIERLTPAQIDKMAECRDKWIAIGLSTEPADRPRAEAAIVDMYRQGGLAPPRKIVWCGSPLSQGLTRVFILGDKLASVRGSVGASVYGQHDASWLAFYDYFSAQVWLRRQTERLSGLWEIAKSAGWALPHKHICWVSERRSLLSRDSRGHLHSLTGPSVMYPDGWKIYAVHGVRVPGDIIERPQSITIKRIDKESNAEVRRVMIDRYGTDRYMMDSGAEEIGRDKYGALYRKPMQTDEDITMVRVTNATPEADGSRKEYWLRVDPLLRPMHPDGTLGEPQEATPRNAVASTFGLRGVEYAPDVET